MQLDHDPPNVMRLSAPDQLKALGHQLRTQIVTLLLDRTASVSQLAEALDTPVGTVGHHLGVLEDAGLVEVVATRQVRGIVEKRYARTARLFLLDHPAPEGAAFALGVLDEARGAATVDLERGLTPTASIAYARVSPERVDELAARMRALLEDFRDEPVDGDVTWAMVVGLVPTDRRPLSGDDTDHVPSDAPATGTPPTDTRPVDTQASGSHAPDDRGPTAGTEDAS